jgi:hypothetical protein
MPLASPPGRPDVVYGFGRIDASGRVADRVTIAALGWRGGDRLTLTAEAGVMIARRDPGGMVTVPARPYIVIPAALRRARSSQDAAREGRAGARMLRSPPRTAAGIWSTSSGAPSLKTTTNSRNILLVFHCLRTRSRHRNQPPAPASYPRVTGRAQAGS